MSKILAIRGDKNRGDEVIALLEMLGGKNSNCLNGVTIGLYYFIEDNIIQSCPNLCGSDYFIITLDEFYKKYPYKVGDKVILGPKLCTIIWMCWECNNIYYMVQGTDVMFTKKVTADELNPYKEQGDKETKVESKREYDELRMPLDDDDKLATEAIIMGETILPPNGYLVGKITQIDNGILVEYVKKKPVYPKTYAECCEVLNKESTYALCGLPEDEYPLFDKLIELKRCRDAYWKIAGEELGLGKPWEPQFENCSIPHYCIFINHRGEVCNDCFYGSRCLLAFPTEEMRDTFYENFGDLIEACKGLL